MNKRTFATTCGVIATISGVTSYAEKPNVVIVLMDDMAYGEANCFRPVTEQNTGFGLVKKSDGTTPISLTDSRILTPNLDKMAAEGIRYTNFYSGGPICGPARASLLQGMHSGNQDCSVRNNSTAGFKMSPGDFTIAEMLKSHGYNTGIVGKYGQCGNARDKVVTDRVIREDIKSILPHKLGFDYIYGALDHTSGHTQFPGLDSMIGSFSKAENARIWEAYAGTIAPLVTVNHELIEIVDTHVYECFQSGIGYVQDRYYEKTEEFITDSVSNNKPFMLYLNPTNPHAGWFLPLAGTVDDNVDFSKGLTSDQLTSSGTGIGSFKWYQDQHAARQAVESGWESSASGGYGDQTYGFSAYAAVISRVDRDLGRIRNLLVAQGIADNTIIIFTSDNGPSDEGGASVNATFSNLLRGGKRSLYEGGLRMPTVIYAPANIVDATKVGSAVDQTGAFCDIMPTLADLTGIDKATLPTNIDGKTFAGTIDGTSSNEQAEFHYWEDNSSGSKQAVRWGNWKAVRTSADNADGSIELYDLKTDICEMNNLASDNVKVVNQMLTFMNDSHIADDSTNGVVPANMRELPTYSEKFNDVPVGNIEIDGSTTINGVTYTGDITKVPFGSYQTQIKNTDGNGYVSLWCEQDTRGDITWDTDGNPELPVSNVMIELPSDSSLTNVSMDISRISTQNWWWYRVQYTTDNGVTWNSLKEINSYIVGETVGVSESVSLEGVDALKISVWRQGGNDPAEMNLDNISYVSLPVNTSASLDLSSDANANVVVTGYKGITGTADRTISAWIKDGVGNTMFFSYGGDGASGSVVVMGLNNGDGVFRVEFGAAALWGTTDLRDSKWHHVALVIGGVSNDVEIFIDGVSEDITPHNPVTVNTTELNDVRIGADQLEARDWPGFVDELRMWDVALTSAQINNMMTTEISNNGGTVDLDPTVNWSNLQLYYRFNTLTLGKADDLSSYSDAVTRALGDRDGDLVNGAVLGEDVYVIFTPAIGMELIQTGSTLKWTIEEEIGVKEYHVINATTGELLEIIVAGEGSYTTTVPAGILAEVAIIGNSGFTQTFISTDGNFVKVAYDLTDGWNLIAMPGENADTSEIDSVFWGWNGFTYELVETPTIGNAVWVYTPVTVQVVVTAEKVAAGLIFDTGWNMVGPTENMKIPIEAHTVYGWNDTYQEITDEDGVLLQGVGYWIFVL